MTWRARAYCLIFFTGLGHGQDDYEARNGYAEQKIAFVVVPKPLAGLFESCDSWFYLGEIMFVTYR